MGADVGVRECSNLQVAFLNVKSFNGAGSAARAREGARSSAKVAATPNANAPPPRLVLAARPVARWFVFLVAVVVALRVVSRGVTMFEKECTRPAFFASRLPWHSAGRASPPFFAPTKPQRPSGGMVEGGARGTVARGTWVCSASASEWPPPRPAPPSPAAAAGSGDPPTSRRGGRGGAPARPLHFRVRPARGQSKAEARRCRARINTFAPSATAREKRREARRWPESMRNVGWAGAEGPEGPVGVGVRAGSAPRVPRFPEFASERSGSARPAAVPPRSTRISSHSRRAPNRKTGNGYVSQRGRAPACEVVVEGVRRARPDAQIHPGASRSDSDGGKAPGRPGIAGAASVSTGADARPAARQKTATQATRKTPIGIGIPNYSR